MSLLDVKGVRKTYGGITAVKNCSFSVEKGSIVALIGPNGAGKTTMFDIITGFVKADKGELRFDGESIGNLVPYKRAQKGIARTFQDIRLFPNISVLDNLLIAMQDKNEEFFHALLQLSSMRDEEQKCVHKARELLKFVGMEEKEYELAGNLSYGQQKLVEIAKTLAQDPKLIMLDEPAAGVNLTMLAKIGKLMRQLQESGKTILFIEHNMDFVMDIADKIVVMDFGEEIAIGPPEKIQNDKRVITAYLGEAL